MEMYIGAAVIIVAIFLISSIKILQEYERGVLFTLGHLGGARGPGVVIVIPMIQQITRVDQRTVTLDVPSQEVITRDNVPVKVNAVIYYRVVDPAKAIVQVRNYHLATSNMAQTTLRGILGKHELDDLLSDREKINKDLQRIIDEHTDPWGIKVTVVEIKDVEIPSSMQRAMAKQAEAERERRAKIIAAEGEHQASEKLMQAAEVLSKFPAAMQLRYLQTLVEVAAENNSTTLFPIPIEMFQNMMPTSAPRAGSSEK